MRFYAVMPLRTLPNYTCIISCQLKSWFTLALPLLKLDSTNSLMYWQPTFLIDRLKNVQNVAACIITRTKKYDHIKPVLRQLHWLPVNQHINYKILLLIYKALNGQVPSYITELLMEPYAPTRNPRSSSKNLQKIPPIKLVSYGHRCFSFAAPSLWNPLPNIIRQSSSLPSFKTYKKTFFFKNCHNLD